MILYGLAPHFKSRLREAINSSIYYSLSFDESLNSVEQKCQLDVNVRFWNECRNIVKTRYYDSKFLDRPNAENLFESIRDASNGLRQENFLQLAMDGPNLNWEVLKKTDEMLVKNDYSKTINIGRCPQRTVHGAFETGATNDWDVRKILKSMFWFLHDSPARSNIYVNRRWIRCISTKVLFSTLTVITEALLSVC